MAERMTERDLINQERVNSGTSWTRNQKFDADGYLILKGLCDPEKLYRPLPHQRGQITYWGKGPNDYTYTEIEHQVEGSFATYWHPQYRETHSLVRKELEKVLGRKLYNTYYYDRFYFPGQELTRHTDRDACEISVTVHIGSNLEEHWPIWIKTPDTYEDKKRTLISTKGENRSVILAPGDGMIYKGCERPHWRDPMPHPKNLNAPPDQMYYHQIFFHYVLADGIRSHCAFDSSR